MDDDLRVYLDRMGDRLTARIETLETKLLTAFHTWAPVDSRLRGHRDMLQALDLEVMRSSSASRG